MNPVLRQQIAQAYVSHRLNHSELVKVTDKLRQVEAGEGGVGETRQLVKDYSAVDQDVRDPVDPKELNGALRYLNLQRQFKALGENKAWSPFQRALYRRLSHPEHDPIPLTAQGDNTGSARFVNKVEDNFESWDRDEDGILTNVEMDAALADPKLTGDDAAAAVVLRRQGDALGRCVEDAEAGVTRSDLREFLLAGIPQNAMATLKVNRGFEALALQASRLGPAPELSKENFDPELVEQGKAGACVMLSTLAHNRPEEIRQMFNPLPDGQVEVYFADGDLQVVRDLTTAERLYHAKSPEDGRWPGLLEVAIGQRIHAKRPQSDGSFRSAANGISPAEAGRALHGQTTHKVSLDDLSLKQTRQLLSLMSESPKPWLAGSRSTIKGRDSQVSVEDLHNGIRNNHAYTIKSFDADQDVVWLRNPWRKGEWVVNFDQKDDGIFSMPLRDFYSSYRWVGFPSTAA